MKRDSIIVSTLAIVAGVGFPLPATATASGPLLSGYGGPGAGSQVVLGSTLLGGGGSGGSSQGGSSPRSGSEGGGSQGTGSAGTVPRGGASGARGSSASTSGHRRGSAGPSASRGSATHHGAAGANPKIPNLRVGPASSAVSSAWFSGADLLALLLAAGALVLIALATMRIARTRHRQASGRR